MKKPEKRGLFDEKFADSRRRRLWSDGKGDSFRAGL